MLPNPFTPSYPISIKLILQRLCAKQVGGISLIVYNPVNNGWYKKHKCRPLLSCLCPHTEQPGLNYFEILNKSTDKCFIRVLFPAEPWRSSFYIVWPVLLKFWYITTLNITKELYFSPNRTTRRRRKKLPWYHYTLYHVIYHLKDLTL